MPKSTHFHVVRDTVSTDKKFRPEDEKIYEQEKQEFQSSQKEKAAKAVSEEDFVKEQDNKTEATGG